VGRKKGFCGRLKTGFQRRCVYPKENAHCGRKYIKPEIRRDVSHSLLGERRLRRSYFAGARRQIDDELTGDKKITP
jgi:hypothetical protein